MFSRTQLSTGGRGHVAKGAEQAYQLAEFVRLKLGLHIAITASATSAASSRRRKPHLPNSGLAMVYSIRSAKTFPVRRDLTDLDGGPDAWTRATGRSLQTGA